MESSSAWLLLLFGDWFVGKGLGRFVTRGRLTRGRAAWIRADERRWSGYTSPEIPLHYHALLKYQNVPAPEAVEAQWKSRAGDARVEIYECARGAAWYVAKMFPYEDTRYDLGGLEHFTRPPESRAALIP